MRTLTERAKQERALPKLWDNGFHPERIEFYLNLMLEHPAPWGGREDYCEFLAAMIGESGLNNLTKGDNAEHGNDNPFVGFGWCQLDSGYHVATIEMLHQIRADPMFSLDYIAGSDDLVKHRGTSKLWLNKQRWHAWEPHLIDPQPVKNPDGTVTPVWSAYKACLAVYDRVTGTA